MRSSHVDLYDHDEDAATYDQDVIRSEDPGGIRRGPRLGRTERRYHPELGRCRAWFWDWKFDHSLTAVPVSRLRRCP